MQKHYVVFKDGPHGKKPRRRHETLGAACSEAMRLAQENNGLFMVYEAVGGVSGAHGQTTMVEIKEL